MTAAGTWECVTTSTAISDEWLDRPCVGAITRCIAEPTVDPDVTIASDWLEWMPLDLVQDDPFICVTLGRWLFPGQSKDGSANVWASHAPRIRTAFPPVPDATRLVCLAGAWTGAPSLIGPLRKANVTAPSTVLGEVFTFAAHVALLQRPSVELKSTIDTSATPIARSAVPPHCEIDGTRMRLFSPEARCEAWPRRDPRRARRLSCRAQSDSVRYSLPMAEPPISPDRRARCTGRSLHTSTVWMAIPILL
ncbi:hypothetical protein ACVWY5_001195 [Bradyrhizobium sp. USDA 3256]